MLDNLYQIKILSLSILLTIAFFLLLSFSIPNLRSASVEIIPVYDLTPELYLHGTFNNQWGFTQKTKMRRVNERHREFTVNIQELKTYQFKISNYKKNPMLTFGAYPNNQQVISKLPMPIANNTSRLLDFNPETVGKYLIRLRILSPTDFELLVIETKE